MNPSRAARGVLAVGAIALVAAMALASRAPGPRAWGLHLPGFLPDSSRFLVMAVLLAGTALLTIDFFQGQGTTPAPAAARPAKGRRPRENAGRSASGATLFGLPAWTGWLLLLPWAWLLARLATRTLFLGDGQIWLDNVRSGHPDPYSEPLATATWWVYWNILRASGIPFEAATARFLPILCGLLAAPLLYGIALEITPRGGSRAAAFAVLATLGSMQLYFGYIESYPMVSVAVLVYLWLGLRRARGADSTLAPALALAAAIAFHLSCVYLIPSFFLLAWREKKPVLWRAGMALLPLAGAVATLLLLGYGPSRWAGAFHIAASGVGPGQEPSAMARPYGVVSLEHAADVLNAILLVLPVPLLLLLASTASRAPRESDHPGFLAAAALPGLLLAAALVLPVAPAQDWDLSAILLLPLAVLGAEAGLRALSLRGRRAAGVTLLGAGALLSFVLVNAGEDSSLHRYETLVGPGARITAYARGYGNDLLATYDIARRDFPTALQHAQRALDAEPAEARYWVKKGAALFQLGRYDEAIPILQEGIRRGPGRDDGYYDLGNCLTKMRRFPEAVTNYREAIRRSEPRPEYFNNLGVALYNSGQRDSARVVWTDVAQRWPWYTLARRSLIQYFGTDTGDSSGVTSAPG
jgi:tetratricopeptide (TPR) repeat protein